MYSFEMYSFGVITRNLNTDNQLSKLISEDVISFICNNHWMSAPQMRFIIFAFFTFETQIETHTGTYAGYASRDYCSL